MTQGGWTLPLGQGLGNSGFQSPYGSIDDILKMAGQRQPIAPQYNPGQTFQAGVFNGQSPFLPTQVGGMNGGLGGMMNFDMLGGVQGLPTTGQFQGLARSQQGMRPQVDPYQLGLMGLQMMGG